MVAVELVAVVAVVAVLALSVFLPLALYLQPFPSPLDLAVQEAEALLGVQEEPHRLDRFLPRMGDRGDFTQHLRLEVVAVWVLVLHQLAEMAMATHLREVFLQLQPTAAVTAKVVHRTGEGLGELAFLVQAASA